MNRLSWLQICYGYSLSVIEKIAKDQARDVLLRLMRMMRSSARQTQPKLIYRAAEFASLSIRSPIRWSLACSCPVGQIILAATYTSVDISRHGTCITYSTSLIIATRQHALGVCMHEAAHYLAFSTRCLNDGNRDFFVPFPIRRVHFDLPTPPLQTPPPCEYARRSRY